MFCEKCGGKCNADRKCYICGEINELVEKTTCKAYKKDRIYRSAGLSFFCIALIVINAIFILFLAIDLSYGGLFPVMVLKWTNLLLCAFMIVLCVFMLKMKKWALITYTVVFVISLFLPLVSFLVYNLLVHVIVLFFIYKNDFMYFD